MALDFFDGPLDSPLVGDADWGGVVAFFAGAGVSSGTSVGAGFFVGITVSTGLKAFV